MHESSYMPDTCKHESSCVGPEHKRLVGSRSLHCTVSFYTEIAGPICCAVAVVLDKTHRCRSENQDCPVRLKEHPPELLYMTEGPKPLKLSDAMMVDVMPEDFDWMCSHTADFRLSGLSAASFWECRRTT